MLVKKCDTYEQLRKHVESIFSDMSHGFHDFIVEEYQQGDIYSIDYYIQDSGEIVATFPCACKR
jgi:hypothetical protein